MFISNILNNETFIRLSFTFASLLSTGFVILFALSKWNFSSLKKSENFKRLISWLAIATISTLAIFLGPIFLTALCACISIVASKEYAELQNLSRINKFLLFFASLFIPASAYFSYSNLFITVSIFSFIVILKSFFFKEKLKSALSTIFGLMYIPAFASYSILYVQHSFNQNSSQNFGQILLIAIITASALANIFAYIFGKIFADKLFNGAKLAPKLSPNKTWAGVLGSLIGAVFGFHLITLSNNYNIANTISVGISCLITFFGILGDLFESWLKRKSQVKDAGNWLPGMGGALDRIDGLLFVLPSSFYCAFLYL